MLTVPNVLLHDRCEPWISQQIARETVQRRRPSGDGGGEQPPTRLQHPGRLAQRLQPISGAGQVIQRTEQEDHVGSVTGHRQGAGVAHSAGNER